MMPTLPPPPVPVECVWSAAKHYRLPPVALIGILGAEGGRPGEVSRNTDGSEDLGPMQINSRWLPTLSRYGATRERLIEDPCTNVWVGAWILALAYSHDGDIWQAIGHYHSWRPKESRRYRRRVERVILRWLKEVPR